MTHDETSRELQRIIAGIDDELGKLRALVAKGEELRETLLKQIAAAAWESGNDPDIVRIVRNDP